MYLSLGISLSNHIFSTSPSAVSKLFCVEVPGTDVILLAVLIPIQSPVTPAVFLIVFVKQFQMHLVVADCLEWSELRFN